METFYWYGRLFLLATFRYYHSLKAALAMCSFMDGN